MKKIAIIGYGYVGKAMESFFKDHYQLVIYDPYLSEQRLIPGVSKKQVNTCDAAFICVPTPMSDDGSCDISIVEETFEWLNVDLVVIKSTVAVGTTKKLIDKYGTHIVFSPEYIGESTYWTPFSFHKDMKETPFYTIGGEKNTCSAVIDLLLPVTGPCKRYNITDSTTAEMAKYMENSFYANKIAFCNEVYDICQYIGVDYNEARELWLSDPRLHRMHTAVFKDNRGFGGKCLPKDTNALVKIAEKAGVEPHLLKGVLASNDRVKKNN
jgi:UDPglucose 6-dehydrogenase